MTDVLNIGNMFSLEDYESSPLEPIMPPIQLSPPYQYQSPVFHDPKIIHDLRQIKVTIEEYQGIDRQTGQMMLEKLPKSRFKTSKYFTQHISQTHYKEALEELTDGISESIQITKDNVLNILHEKGSDLNLKEIKKDIQQEKDQCQNVRDILPKVNTNQENDYSDYSDLSIDTHGVLESIGKAIEDKDNQHLLKESVEQTVEPLTDRDVMDIVHHDVYQDLSDFIEGLYQYLNQIKDIIDSNDHDMIFITDLTKYIFFHIEMVYKVLNNRKTLYTLILNQYNNQD